MAIRKTRAQLDEQMNQLDHAGADEPDQADPQEPETSSAIDRANASALKDASEPEAAQDLAETQDQPNSIIGETDRLGDQTRADSSAEEVPTDPAAFAAETDATAEEEPTDPPALAAEADSPANEVPTDSPVPGAADSPAEEVPTNTPVPGAADSPAEEVPTNTPALEAEAAETDSPAEEMPTDTPATEAEAARATEPVETQSPAEAGEENSQAEEDEAQAENLGALQPAKRKQIKHLLESLLFASSAPLSVKKLSEILSDVASEVSARTLRALVEELRDDLREAGRGIRVVEVAGSYQLRTPSEAAPFVRKLVSIRPPRLTRATLETLAIVAYRQPVTRPEIEDIRGVDCGAVLKHLLDKKLVKIMGRKDEVGRPLLYATTPDFLEFFSLKDLRSLPTLKDFVELSDEHRAQLGIEAIKKPEQKKELSEFRFVVEPTDSYNPVGQDEVIEELSDTLASIGKKNRDLHKSGILDDEEEQPPEEAECTQADTPPASSTTEVSAESKSADSTTSSQSEK